MQLFIEQALETKFGAAFDRDIEMKVRILNSFQAFKPTCLQTTRVDSIICEI